MSQEMIDSLNKQVAEKQQMIDSYAAHLEAHKQMLNEQIQGSLNLRAGIAQFQKMLQEANAKINSLTADLNKANEKIVSLEDQAVKKEDVAA